jgi:holliday junction DNA helicase RuvA
MIGLLTGQAKNQKRNPVLIDVHQVGYVVHVTDRIASAVKLNETYTFYIHTHVREDALNLYGFMTQSDLDLFELLLTVSGIGPKTALLVIDRGAKATEQAVRNGDVDFFTTIPRLGKKNAQKIIIELKSKLGSLKELDLMGESDGETKQLLDALLSMGFGRNEVLEVIKKLDAKDKTLEQKVRRALQMLGRPTKK